MHITCLPLDVLVIIFNLIGKDIIAALSVCKLFFRAYRSIVPTTPPRYIYPKTWGCDGRKLVDEFAVIATCGNSSCPRMGCVFGMVYASGIEYRRLCKSLARCRGRSGLFSPKCSQCDTHAIAIPAQTESKIDTVNSACVLSHADICKLVYNGISAMPCYLTYTSCDIAKRDMKATFDASGAPTNRSAEIVYKYRFLISIHRSKSFAERLNVYTQYMLATLPRRAPAPTVKVSSYDAWLLFFPTIQHPT